MKNGLYVLGSRDVPIYLFRAEKTVLFDAGIVKLGRIYEEAIKAALGKVHPKILFLTHMHFDHCGTVSYLKPKSGQCFLGSENVVHPLL